MILIVGLGNPGPKYQNNRHNVGFQFLEFIDPLFDCPIVKKDNNKLYQSTMKQYNNETIILAKPKTFMNNSGTAVKKLVEKFKIKNEKLIIVHDDLDIPFGKFHIQLSTGPLLHNGLESVEQYLKTKDYYRVRIGIDNRLPDRKISGETYTLQNFLLDEKKILITEIFPKIFTQLQLDLKNLFKIII